MLCIVSICTHCVKNANTWNFTDFMNCLSNKTLIINLKIFGFAHMFEFTKLWIWKLQLLFSLYKDCDLSRINYKLRVIFQNTKILVTKIYYSFKTNIIIQKLLCFSVHNIVKRIFKDFNSYYFKNKLLEADANLISRQFRLLWKFHQMTFILKQWIHNFFNLDSV